jgi:hypothetical protein
MMRVRLILVVLLAAGCEGGGSVNEVAVSNMAEAAHPKPAPGPRPSSVPASDCPPPPSLALSDSFGDSARPFSADWALFQRTKVAFEAAYRKACASGILRERPLLPPGAERPGDLLLKNAQDANIASIYRVGDGARPTVLEYPFVTSDGATHVPTEKELGEAIYCSVYGSSEKEQEESGRCLPD